MFNYVQKIKHRTGKRGLCFFGFYFFWTSLLFRTMKALKKTLARVGCETDCKRTCFLGERVKQEFNYSAVDDDDDDDDDDDIMLFPQCRLCLLYAQGIIPAIKIWL